MFPQGIHHSRVLLKFEDINQGIDASQVINVHNFKIQLMKCLAWLLVSNWMSVFCIHRSRLSDQPSQKMAKATKFPTTTNFQNLAILVNDHSILRNDWQKKAHTNNLLDNTSKEHLTSSTVGHIISGSPIPSGVLSSDKPDDIEHFSSAIHFSSNEPRDENCHETSPCIH